MKRFLLFALFWISLLGGLYMAHSADTGSADIKEREDILTGNDQNIWATVVCASRFADVSLQQNTSVNVSSFVRRYPQFRPDWERLFNFTGKEKQLITSRFQQAFGHAKEYTALLKQSGYYLYNLCKLII